MDYPTTSAELRELLTSGVPLLMGGALPCWPLAGVETEAEPVSLSSLNKEITVVAEDLRVTVGVGAPMGEIEKAAGEHGFELFGDPLLDERATLYDLAISGYLSRMQPSGGRRLGQLNGVRTPTPDSDELILLGCITAKGVTGYNLARSGVVGRPSLPVLIYELTLKPRRKPRLAFTRSFPTYSEALSFALPKDTPLWGAPGLGGVEVLYSVGRVELAAWVAGGRAEDGSTILTGLGFTELEPEDWVRKKEGLRGRLPVDISVVVAFEPPDDAEGVVALFGYPLAGPWLAFYSELPGEIPKPPANIVLEELWPGARLVPAATVV
ncbi:FAD-binding oxidoreductase [bacterium]|nr:FAD-binding oxidoreductase [bacterium]